MWRLLLGSARALDPDGDGVPDERDGCDLRFDPQQGDRDGDGFGDACDVCPGSGAGLELLSEPLAVARLDAPGALLGIDVDRDGDEDLVVGTATSVAWVANLGGGAFGPVVVVDAGMSDVRDLERGDLDGDGLDEVIAADARGVVAFQLRGGLGRKRTLLARPGVVDVAPGHLDGDRVLDLAVGVSGGVGWHPGLGGGALGPEVRLRSAPGYLFRVAVGDLDLDGDDDLVGSGAATVLYRNEGAGPSAPTELARVGGELALGDLDGRGPLDVVVSSRDGVTEISSSGGVWVVGAVVPLPPVLRGAAVGEIDGVAPADVVVVADTALRVLLAGAAPLAVGPTLQEGAAVAAIDLTGDGLADVVVADRLGDAVRVAPSQARCGAADTDGDGLGDAVELLERGTDPTRADTDADGRADGADVCPTDPTDPDDDGDGVCQTDDLCPLALDPDQADTDGDGWGDVCDVCAGVGVGLSLFGAPVELAPGAADDVSPPPPVDLDGDGDLDVVWPGLGVMENLGHGRFATHPAPDARAAAVADVDADGLPDLVLDGPAGVRVALNLGGLAFGPTVDVAQGVDADDLAAGDLDLDGLPEVLACSGTTHLVVLRNLGDLAFEPVELTTDGGCWQVALADVDSDGDPDPVADIYFKGTLWFESGGRFERHWISETWGLGDLELGDLDGDGDPDLAVSLYAEGISLAENRGGTFARRWSWPYVRGHEVSRVALGDLDGDGSLDVLAGRAALDAHAALGAWRFGPPVTLEAPFEGRVVTGDLDGDGDDDPLLGVEGGLAWVPADGSCVRSDLDGDDLRDAEETTVLGTDPRAGDTDRGGAGDGDEVALGTDPLDPADDVVPDTGQPAEDTAAPTTSEDRPASRRPAEVGDDRSVGCATAVGAPTWLLLVASGLVRRRARPGPPAPPRSTDHRRFPCLPCESRRGASNPDQARL